MECLCSVMQSSFFEYLATCSVVTSQYLGTPCWNNCSGWSNWLSVRLPRVDNVCTSTLQICTQTKQKDRPLQITVKRAIQPPMTVDLSRIQPLEYIVVISHHKNDVAERVIQTINDSGPRLSGTSWAGLGSTHSRQPPPANTGWITTVHYTLRNAL